MKRLSILGFLTAAAFAQTPALTTVYVLPMSGGLDQYLAGSLTREHVLQVVADPKLADAFLTDTLGEGFEQRLSKLHPRKDGEKSEDKNKDSDTDVHPAFRSTNARGTIFLVDAKSREVLWSDYEKAPRSRSTGDLNREAERITKKLRARSAK